ncbi:hypothetical protein GCM10008024_41220 [Allgaiera indica]|uniref:Antitoxin Xre/MbcA/ParS-like toxin-binding domain-containing protein n=1 Tax=Allgaiera indica TaxID=765699 RepID=A0AAN5A1E6_9RHOB|nr:antitoxin Xre/MbcA/ParS toxin-binding domain-containing protein [Allgaiera indica]GHE06565.1 hypothetical protein GCM10008024_41220 [Allgaiera indica]
MPTTHFSRETRQILDQAIRRFGNPAHAREWFLTEPLPGYAGKTAAQLAAQGHFQAVLDYFDAVDAGVHA